MPDELSRKEELELPPPPPPRFAALRLNGFPPVDLRVLTLAVVVGDDLARVRWGDGGTTMLEVAEEKMACSAAEAVGRLAACCLDAPPLTMALTPPLPPLTLLLLRLLLSMVLAAAMALLASRSLFSSEIRSKQSSKETRRNVSSPCMSGSFMRDGSGSFDLVVDREGGGC